MFLVSWFFFFSLPFCMVYRRKCAFFIAEVWVLFTPFCSPLATLIGILRSLPTKYWLRGLRTHHT